VNKQETVSPIELGSYTKVWNPTFISIFMANILMQLSQSVVQSVVARYADYLQASEAMVGIVVSMFAITALLFRVFAGPAMETFNKKILVIIAMGVLAISYFGYSLSSSISLLVVFRLVQGIGQALASGTCLALAAEALPSDKMGTGIGYFSLGQVISMSIGPTIGLWLIDAVGYHYLFIIGSAGMIIGALMATMIKHVHVSKKAFKISIKSIFSKEAVLPAIVLFLIMMAAMSISSFLNIYAKNLGENLGTNLAVQIGAYYTINALVMLVTRPLFGKLMDRIGVVKVVVPAMVCFMICFYLISIAQTLAVFLIAAFFGGIGQGTCQPAMQTLCVKSVSDDKRGVASNTSFIAIDLGSFVGPILAGVIAGTLGYAMMFRLVMIPIGIAAAILIIARKPIRNTELEFESRAIKA